MTNAESNVPRAPARRIPTPAQLQANRRNARRGGVKTEAGKLVSRLNARKSGIFAVVLTPADRDELAPILESFMADFRPVGQREKDIVEEMALTSLRLQRCTRLEAERFAALSAACATPGDGLALSSPSGATIVDLFRAAVGVQRYEASFWNRFMRLSRELDRLQHGRAYRNVPAPDVGQPEAHKP